MLPDRVYARGRGWRELNRAEPSDSGRESASGVGVPLAHAGPSGDVQQRPGEELCLNLLYGIQRIRTASPAGSVANSLAGKGISGVRARPT
jgi:hypothetical protein